VTYALQVGLRYLRSKKRETISVVAVIAMTGVALGVAALLSVMSITAGFQREFRDKVLGVNAHVLVLKYGLDFDEYRDVVQRARTIPEVVGAAPFIINEMMLAKDDRLSGVLVKGVDPAGVNDVLDLPHQLIDGSLDGLRRQGAMPAIRTEDAARGPDKASDTDLDAFLTGLAERPISDGLSAPQPPDSTTAGRADAGANTPDNTDSPSTAGSDDDADDVITALPVVAVPTPEEMEAALNGGSLGSLPSDELEAQMFAEEELELAGEPEDVASLPGIVIGTTLAKSLGLGVGHKVRIISPLAGIDTSMWRANGGAPQSREYRVIGIFEAGFQEYDSKLVYIDLYEAQVFQDQGDTVIGVEIRLNDIDEAARIAKDLERDLGGGPFHTMDWQELNRNLFEALQTQKIMLSMVFAIIILVAAFCVIATMIMVVLEKRREIAILKAMGATDSSVLLIFMVQGAAIGVVGTLLGLLVGGAACAYLTTFQFPLDPKVYLIDHVPVQISIVEFAWTVAISMFICVSATWIPSWWAARMLPADGMRYQ